MDCQKKSYKILIIDDDPMALMIAKGVFEEDCHTVTTVNSIKSAKVYLNSLEEKEYPDICIVDVFMPEEDGFDFIDFMKNDLRFYNIPFILQSGNYDHELQEKGLLLGASDFILKPYNRTIAKIRVEKAIQLSKLQNKLEEEIASQTICAKKRAIELEKKTSEMVDVLISTIGIRDERTKGHSSRVAKISTHFAKKLGYPRLDRIQKAGLLHDIGKVGISNYILNKPDKLLKEEYDKVKLHPGIGKDLLSNVEDFQIEADVAYHHHEWWDGSGYPQGLKGEEISFESRIVAIADVFDVLKVGRIYQHAKTDEEIAMEFERMAGIQFDPELVKVFVQLVRQKELDYIFENTQIY